MTTSDQKQRERSILNVYLQMLGLEGDVKYQERPDFIVTSGDLSIGVEITEYHQPAYSDHRFSRTLVEAEWDRIRTAVVEYRKTHEGLENLTVLLSFIDLVVPRRSEHHEFIRAVHDEIKRVEFDLGDRFTTILIGDQHPAVLSRYLKRIDVRIANCYMEWDWNHMVASVGTSDDELADTLAPKLKLKRPEGIDELHLVVAGDGPTGGTYIGYLSPEWLESCTGLNETLYRSEFEVVAILNYDETCIWRHGRGWSNAEHA